MAEIPEHLLKRAAERKAQLEAEASGAGDASNDAFAANEETSGSESSAGGETASVEASPAPEEKEEVYTGLAAKVPIHLLQRSKKRRAVLSGESVADSGSGTTTAVAGAAPPSAPAMVGPDGHTHRLLTVVKSGSIQQTKAEAQDKVHTWPHLVSIEFGAMVIVTAGLVVFSIIARAPLLGLADLNQTPNPSKAPWYFLGLQELLTMFHPMVAGVTIPGVALVILALTPYFDKNPSNKPSDRKFAIISMTMFLIFWAVLVIIGSFFRGQGFNFVFPMNDGVFFELYEERQKTKVDQSTIIVFSLIAVLAIAGSSVVLLGRNAAKGKTQSDNADLESLKADGKKLAEQTEQEAKSVKTEEKTVLTEEEIGISRRKFLNRSLYALLGLGFGLPFLSSLLAFLIPTGKGGFGGLVNVSTPIPDIISTINSTRQPFYIPEARAYIVEFPNDSQPAVEAAQATDSYTQNPAIIEGMVEYGLVALYQKCPHLGCRVPWCESSQWFECPCHGSKYNRVGEKTGGPTPRGMDRFPFQVTGNSMVINTNLAGVVSGPPDGVNTTRQSAEGPVCV